MPEIFSKIFFNAAVAALAADGIGTADGIGKNAFRAIGELSANGIVKPESALARSTLICSGAGASLATAVALVCFRAARRRVDVEPVSLRARFATAGVRAGASHAADVALAAADGIGTAGGRGKSVLTVTACGCLLARMRVEPESGIARFTLIFGVAVASVAAVMAVFYRVARIGVEPESVRASKALVGGVLACCASAVALAARRSTVIRVSAIRACSDARRNWRIGIGGTAVEIKISTGAFHTDLF